MKIHEIEKGVPIPVNARFKYPWPQMAVENSVFIQAENGERLYELKRKVWFSSHRYGKKTGKKFLIKVNQANNGVRVWRIE